MIFIILAVFILGLIWLIMHLVFLLKANSELMDSIVVADSDEILMIKQINLQLKKAQAKHPEFVDTKEKAMCILIEEVGEIGQAINDGKSKSHIISECLDAIAVLIRLIWLIRKKL